jgi:hypothetical protein
MSNLSGGKQSHGGGSHNANPLGSLIGGLTGSGGHGSSGGHGAAGGLGGKLAGQIVSGIFSGGKTSGSQQHNYSGQQQQGAHGSGGGGLVGSLIGGAAGMFGGKHNNQVRDW